MRRSPFLAVPLLIALAACSSTQDVLEPAAVAAAPPAASAVDAQGDVTTPAPAAAAPLPPSAAISSRTRLRFDPIVGATVESATPLTERLASRARAKGIGLAGSADPSTTHVLKGYFSAITEGKNTTVIYVWDVYDPAGNRLHRINGQQQLAADGQTGWASVKPADMQAIADSTIEQLATWLGSSAG